MAQTALYHHERIDGSGYYGLCGNEIPFFSRIIAVADVYEALTADRPYRKAWSKEDAVNFIENNAGILFDELVTDALLQIV